MHRTFCDHCGAVADVYDAKGYTAHLQELSKDQKYQQTRMFVRVNFEFRSHPNGFGGAPDLCRHCQRTALQELLKGYGATLWPEGVEGPKGIRLHVTRARCTNVSCGWKGPDGHTLSRPGGCPWCGGKTTLDVNPEEDSR